MASFAYIVPATLQSTLQTLSQAGPATQPLAGGTRLLADLRQGTSQPETLIDLRLLADLRQIQPGEQTLTIGALVSFARLEREPLIRERAPLLAQMAASLGNPLIRNAATLGGNIISARTMIADAVVPLIALDARLVLYRSASATQAEQRTLNVAEYLLQEPDPRELITWILVPVLSPNSHTFYAKVSNRKAGAASIASVATHITSREERITAAHIVLGALTSQPFRPQRVEALLNGETLPLRATVIAHCLYLLRADLPEALHDTRASAAYRSAMGCALLKKSLEQMKFITSEKYEKLP